MLGRTPDKVRNVVFELCGDQAAFKQYVTLPSCSWYFAKYDATYWGGAPFTTLQMMRDADDVGQCSGAGCQQRVNFKKEGLFDLTRPLFPDMMAGNYEEWTVYNRSFSDHPWHLHQNHVLITKINGVTLPLPEWHDTLLVPAAQCDNGTPIAGRLGGPAGVPRGARPVPQVFPHDPTSTCGGPPVDINLATPGSITFRVYFKPITVGCFVAHCHTIDHEDLGMMQRMDILPAIGQPNGCKLDGQALKPNLKTLLASNSSFPICSSSPQRFSRKQIGLQTLRQ
jgi:Multicopper oxidase